MKSTPASRQSARKARIRAKVSGTAQKPRLSVFRSNVAFYAQLIDDTAGKTLAAASSLGTKESGVIAAKSVGAAIAKAAAEKKISEVVFDRNGYAYLGAISALATSAREAGLHF